MINQDIQDKVQEIRGEYRGLLPLRNPPDPTQGGISMEEYGKTLPTKWWDHAKAWSIIIYGDDFNGTFEMLQQRYYHEGKDGVPPEIIELRKLERRISDLIGSAARVEAEDPQIEGELFDLALEASQVWQAYRNKEQEPTGWIEQAAEFSSQKERGQ